jgi:hypothetical protein
MTGRCAMMARRAIRPHGYADRLARPANARQARDTALSLPKPRIRLPDPPGGNSFRLEHVPKKLIDFFDQNMLQLFDFKRFLSDQVIPPDRKL